MPLFNPQFPYFFNVKTYGAVGDGVTDDTVACQTAADNAVVNGGTIFFPEGTYIISADLVVSAGNYVYFLGAGMNSILKAASGSGPNVIRLQNSNHVGVGNLQIDGNKANVAPQGGQQYSIEMGVYVTGCDDVHVTECWVHDCYSGGILCDSSTNLVIESNRCTANGDGQIYLKPTGGGTGCTNFTISDNMVSGGSYSGIIVVKSSQGEITGNVSHDNGPTSGQGAGVGVEGCSHVAVTGNQLSSNAIQGVSLKHTNDGGATNLHNTNITVSGNNIYNTTSGNGDAGGVSVTDSDYVTVTGNNMYGCGYGVNVSTIGETGSTYVKITGNLIAGSTNTGIKLQGGSSNITVSDNTVSGTAGHNLYSTCSKTYIMTGNRFLACTGDGKAGVYMDTGSDGVIMGNFFMDNADNGINLNAGGPFEVRNNVTLAGASIQGRLLYENTGAGPTILAGNKSSGQTNEDFHFTHASSRAYANSFDNKKDHNSGTASITTGNTSVTVTHGLFTTPSASDIQVTPTTTWGSGAKFWVDTITSTQFNINSNANPAGTWSFAWRAITPER